MLPNSFVKKSAKAIKPRACLSDVKDSKENGMTESVGEGRIDNQRYDERRKIEKRKKHFRQELTA